jgi:3-oxoacyl-[acyl-carrier-protein] synthase-3
VEKRPAILGTGKCVPKRTVTNADLEKIVDTSDEWITTRTGIKTRYFSDDKTAASDLGTVAAQQALEMAGVSGADVDLIIVGTVTPDYAYPSTACIIQNNIGNTKGAGFDQEAGCSGFLYGLTIAEQFILTGKCRYVLVVGVECLSKVMNMTDRGTCVLFGDGAGAALVGPSADGESGILGTFIKSDGSLADLLKQPAGGSRLPASHDTVDKNLHTIHMEGNKVFPLAVRSMEEAATALLDQLKIPSSEIAMVITHQANLRIIQSLQKRLQQPDEKVFINIDRYGNTSAASIPIALDEAVRDNKIKKGDLILLASFGAGFTWASALIKW